MLTRRSRCSAASSHRKRLCGRPFSTELDEMSGLFYLNSVQVSE